MTTVASKLKKELKTLGLDKKEIKKVIKTKTLAQLSAKLIYPIPGILKGSLSPRATKSL